MSDRALRRNSENVLNIGQLVTERRAAGLDIISLGLGEPHFQPPPEVLDAVHEAVNSGETAYRPGPGMPELRAKIAMHLQNTHGMPYSDNNIVFTPGAKQGLFMALLATLRRNENALYFTPSYVSFRPILELVAPEGDHHSIPLAQEGANLDEEVIKNAMSKKITALLLNSPHNPTGMMLEGKDIRLLCDLASDYGSWIISDEVYADLAFGSKKHISPASVEFEKIITIGGLSKTFAIAGWRAGFVAASSPILERIQHINQHTHTNTSTLTQFAAIAAYKSGFSHLKKVKQDLQQNAKCAHETLGQYFAMPWLPSGGIFAFPKMMHSGTSADGFIKKLIIETGVVVASGSSFGSEWNNHVRVSLALDPLVFSLAMERIEGFCEKHGPPYTFD